MGVHASCCNCHEGSKLLPALRCHVQEQQQVSSLPGATVRQLLRQ
jgi:hypothetical protein